MGECFTFSKGRGIAYQMMRSHTYNMLVSDTFILCQRCYTMTECWWLLWRGGMPPHLVFSYRIERWLLHWRMSCILCLPIHNWWVGLVHMHSPQERSEGIRYYFGQIDGGDKTEHIYTWWFDWDRTIAPLLCHVMVVTLATCFTIDVWGSHLHGGLIHTIHEMVESHMVFRWGCHMLVHLYQEIKRYIHYEY